MLQEHTKLLADKQKKEETLTAPSRIDLITTSEGLYLALESIDDEDVSKTRRNTKKTKLLREQIDIRKNC